ncbi:MAG: monooxygenase [Myxococcaceae bacterium]
MFRPSRPVWPVLGVLLAAGCSGSSSVGGPDAGALLLPYYGQVQVLFQQNCQSCHVTGGFAPFALETLADARSHAVAIADAVRSRRMPPWKPAEGCQAMEASRRLSDADVATIVAWATGGTPEGDSSKAVSFSPPDGGLPWVDLTLAPDQPYAPKAALSDDYHCFLLDPGLTQNQYLVGVDVQPEQRPLVHHVLLFATTALDAIAADTADPDPGWTCFGGPGTSGTPRLLGGWVPGTQATRFPADTGILLRAGEVVVMQVHYNLAAGPSAPDTTRVKMQLARGPVAKPAAILPLANLGFNIPAGATGYTSTIQVASPASGVLWGVIPHMHTKGRRVTVKAGNTCLVDIPAWDFHWQQAYFFTTPLPLTVGTQLSLSCTWDNPTASAVTWGEKTTDEMCLTYVYATQN